MAFYVRRMRHEDIPQVMVIDREAFPTQWPPPNLQHELRNRLAHYFVVCDDSVIVEVADAETTDKKGLSGWLSRLWRRTGGKDGVDAEPYPGHRVAGYVGFWAMADEAHITAIAVSEALRRRGLGEMLIIATIESARELYAETVTLEVRVSNTGAQQLYSKHGFNMKGVRKGYYTDNREDAYIMTTDDINSVVFRERLNKLKEAHRKKWGHARNKADVS